MRNYLIIWLLISIGMVSFFQANGQQTRLDSVSIRVRDKMEIRMTLYKRNNLSEQAGKDLKSLQEVLKICRSIPTRGSYTITFKPEQSLTISDNVNTQKLIWEKGKQACYQFQNQCNIQTASYYMQVLFNDIQELQSDSLVIKVKEVLNSIYNRKGRFTLTYKYNYSSDSMTYDSGINKMNGSLDYLALQAGVGTSIIKNKLTTDITLGAGIVLSQGGYPRHDFYGTSSFYFDFNSKGDPTVSNMISLGYRYNLARNSDVSNWLGVEFGYLKSSKSDLFDKNTLKFGVNWDLGKYIRVSPQLFFTSDFAKAYPGIRIGFGF
jgi:hypothetical protein